MCAIRRKRNRGAGMDIEATLREMTDREAITLLSRKYAMGTDMRDWELYRSIFTDEIETDFTSWSGGEPRTQTADQWVAGIRTGISGWNLRPLGNPTHDRALHDRVLGGRSGHVDLPTCTRSTTSPTTKGTTSFGCAGTTRTRRCG